MGGQTALNLAIEADRQQVWKQYGVKMIGVDIAAIELTEDREKFRAHMVHLGVGVAPPRIANSFLEGKEASQEIGFPLVIRPSFTLGGTGGSFVHKADQFDEALRRGLDASPTHEVLVEKAVLGWKEFELELLRDKNDNVVIICTVENLDPMGIHTGDSITVAPAMTLSDTGFQKMRDSAIMMMRSIGNFAGGCNVQFAMDPVSEDIIAVEINPRVSRSSALASKATGYPIAKIAAKLALGFTLDELANPVTGTTSALFEPSLDYVIVKMPRWNFEKFWGADTRLGLQMKSVGEVMAIGRSFNEALQKACQSLENDRQGLGADKKEWFNTQDILERLEKVSDDRIFRLKDALRLGVPEKSVQKLTGIDPWFIREIKHLVHLDEQIARYNVPEDLTPEFMTELKKNGYSDAQIAWLMRIDEELVTRHRRKLGLRRVYKRVDTCAAEFEARTNYYYSTFDDHNESEVHLGKKRIMVLGSGPNRIGQGIEFDYCCVHGVMANRKLGMEAIMINCNPETVSTDSDLAD